MGNNGLKIPAIIIAIGLVVALVACLFTCVIQKPVITEYDFPYSVTYKLDGEIHTYEGIYRCSFRSTGKGSNPLERYYEGVYLTNPSESHPAAYTIAQKDGLELCIVTIFSNKYLMGDAEGEPEAALYYDPYLAVMDDQGMEYADIETVGQFDVELVSWEAPQPVENSFVFGGISLMHDTSMIAMLAVGLLAVLAVMIFVKKGNAYNVVDKISLVLNLAVVVLAIPFVVVAVYFMPIVTSVEDIGYQMYICIPAICAFTVAASIALRRKGFTKSGFFVQFIGPVLFVVPLVLEAIL